MNYGDGITMSNPQDDLTPDNEEVFAAPLIRLDGHAEEMTEGYKLPPFSIPTMKEIKMESPNGTVFTVSVDDSGNLQVA